ncbi:MAG: VCBS repeat-containing protein [Candidatus Zixiibacteriota bacterium]
MKSFGSYKKLIIAAVIVSGVVFCTGNAIAADQDLFDIYSLEIEGTIYGYVTGDFNGDKANDIALIYSTPTDPNTRYIGLYLQKRGGGFQVQSDHLKALPVGFYQINAADLDDNGMAEIILIDGNGVLSIDFSPAAGFGNPIRIIRNKTIFSLPMYYGVLTSSFIFEMNGEPGNELIIPSERGYLIYEKDDRGNYDILAQLNVPVFCNNSNKNLREFNKSQNFHININLPEIYVLDGNLDLRPDIYFLWNKKLSTFIQDSTGNFPQEPDVEFDFFPIAGENHFCQSRLFDFNGDKRPDLVATATSGGISNTETMVQCHISDNSGKIRAIPSRTITLSDSHCNLFVDDFNGDNIADLVLPAVELGTVATIQMLLMKSADLHLLIYPFEGGLPTEEPTKRAKYDFNFNFDESLPTSEIYMEWSGDYNGDNIPDLVYLDGTGKVLFYWGKKDNYLSNKFDIQISLDRVSEVYPARLSQNAFSDLIVMHNLSGNLDRITVLRNKNK